MARTPDARIKPELLVWARESGGISLAAAARSIGVAEARLADWESGATRPSIAQLRKAGETYKRPLAVFFLPEPPRDFQPLTDFRRLPEAEDDSWSPALRLAVRRAQFQQQAAGELYAALGEEIPRLPRLSLSRDDPDDSGNRIRDFLGVSLPTQEGWRTKHEALRGWTLPIEELGVLVLQVQRVERREMRGFSLSDGAVPAIVLNGSDAPVGKIFTLLHELAHLLLREGGVCDLHDRRSSSPTDKTELFCNAVSAATLLPSTEFRTDAERMASNSADWDDPAISTLAEKYSVSREVVVRRLWSQGFVEWDFLRTKVSSFRQQFERAQESKQRTAGGPSFSRMRVRDYGRSYVRLALEAYRRDEINASQLSEFVEVKLNNLTQLEAELIGSGG